QQAFGGDLGADVPAEVVAGIDLVLGDAGGVPGGGVDARGGDVHDPADAVAAGVGEHVGRAGDIGTYEVAPAAPGAGQGGAVDHQVGGLVGAREGVQGAHQRGTAGGQGGGVAAGGDHPVPVGAQLGDDVAAEEPARPGDQCCRHPGILRKV